MAIMDEKIQGITEDIFADVVEAHSASKLFEHLQIDKDCIINILDNLVAILFPVHFADQKTPGSNALKYEMGTRLSNVVEELTKQIKISLQQHPEYMNKNDDVRSDHAEAVVGVFIDSLPNIRQLLKKDIQAGYDGDPAATSFDEIIFSYPGFYAIMVNRIAHVLYKMEIPMIPRIMTEYAHGRTGVDIHPGAQIGEYFFIDHGTGVVIGETTIIGNHVKLYQGVTLGGLSTRAGRGLIGVQRHPTIGDNVTIYSNASILGGETVIGDGCIISGNCFITSSVPPGMRVSNAKGELQIIPDRKEK
ncbi:Serine acetyltransferase [Anaerovibrio sp. JC8]|uniref:serine O-acetyltransferase n=1 Tax=Anaerovibrio sp. JC8 TaxID=1240085 RepID=UPI000A0CD721|nr:serine acetyltransferase [Anaerovibrio sp. JC8]ORT99741.1 Serine acetyltransferase [Anaerovibrio sp. JC8]